jgi:ubiquinone/menaquinone biosynthesis C-methylase UbiE
VSALKRLIRQLIPAGLLVALFRPGTSRVQRAGALATLLAFWTAVYARYRKAGIEQTHKERELLKRVNWEAFWRHYNERVPTIEEEFDLWGEYHQLRHEMRYDLLAETVREHLLPGGRVLDVGCGAGLVADRILDVEGHYVGFDFGGPNIDYAQKKFRDLKEPLHVSIVRCDGEMMPFADRSMDVVVMSEVIEHLLRPERAVWEVARVMKPGGVFIMTTNNASEMPLRSPLSHLFPWLEKAIGADVPGVISLRPWIWPERVDPELLQPGSPDIYLPHTHHIQVETRRLFAAAGMETFHWSTFEFPPPQSSTGQFLQKRGRVGEKVVNGIEWAAQRTPVVRRLGTHVFMVARKTGTPIAPEPPPGVWPGPFSNGSETG